MMDEDALIELLNGFGSSHLNGKFDTEVFLDEDGIPTDRFLQALKSDMAALPSVDDVNDFSFTKETTRRLDEEFQPEYKSRRYVTDDEYFDEARHKRGVQFHRNDVGDYPPSDRESAHPSRFANSSSLKQKNAKTTKPKKKKEAKQKAPTTTTHCAEKTTTSSSLKQRNAPVGGSVSASILAAGSSSYAANSAVNSAAAVEEVHFPRAVGIDTTEIEVEAESRVKSLQLRIQGQLQTIRSLESQLGDALQLVEARNKQLVHCNARLKAVSSAPQQGAPGGDNGKGSGGGGGPPGVVLRSEAAAAKATELAEQYKVQVDFLQAKLSEEQARRQRAEERARVLKNYSEKAKARCLALESQGAELKGALAEATARMERFRKSYKDNASEVQAQKSDLAGKEEECARLRRQLEKTESAVRNLQMALDHSREELRVQKVETSAAQSKYKQLALQVEIQAERDATKRAEERLRSMSGVETAGPHHGVRGHSTGPLSSSPGPQSRDTGRTVGRSDHSDRAGRRVDGPPQHSAPANLSELRVSAQEQLQILQELSRVDQEQHRSLPAYPPHDHHDQHRPPLPPAGPEYGHGDGYGQGYGYDDRRLRTTLERSERRLDHDVVLENMMSANYGPRSVGSASASDSRPGPLPPRWRQNSSDSTGYAGSVSSSNNGNGSYGRSLLSTRAERLSAYRGGVSMSDSELDPKDSRPRRAEDLRSSADFEHSHSHRPRQGASSSGAVSFIRQKVIDSSSAGRGAGGNSNNSGISSFATHHQYPDYSAQRRAGIADPDSGSKISALHGGLGSSDGGGSGSPSRGSLYTPSLARQAPAPSSVGSLSTSGGGKQMSRLQALYDRISSAST